MPARSRARPLGLALAFLMITLALAGLAPVATADHTASTPTSVSGEVWRQLGTPGTGVNGCGTSVDDLSLTAGQRYHIVLGANERTEVNDARRGVMHVDGLFSVQGDGGLVLGANAQSDIELVHHQNFSDSVAFFPWWAVVAVTPTVSQAYDVRCVTWASGGGFLWTWGTPAGLSHFNADLPKFTGYADHAVITSGATFPMAVAFRADMTFTTETDVKTNQVDISPGDTNFNWARLDTPTSTEQTFFNPTCSLYGQVNFPTRVAQSIPLSAAGYQPASLTIPLDSGSSVASGSLSVVFGSSSTITHNAYDSSWARWVNISYTQTTTSTIITPSLIMDWQAQTVTVTSGNFRVDSYVWGGDPAYTFPAAPQYVALQGSGPYQYGTISSCTAGSGNTVYWQEGTETPTANLDTARLALSHVTTFRQTVETSITLNERNVAGALYVYVREDMQSLECTNDNIRVSSNLGGNATQLHSWGGLNTNNGLTMSVRGFRFMYLDNPWNTTTPTTLTLTFDLTGLPCGNTAWVATGMNFQPVVTTHVTRLSFTGDITHQVLGYYVEDEYYTQVTLTVKECVDSTCATFTDVLITNATYTLTTAGGRVESGTTTAGVLVFTGTDLSTGKHSLELSGSYWAKKTWTLDLGGTGTFAFTIGTLPGSGSLGSISLEEVKITFTDNTSRVVPDIISLNVSRSFGVNLYVDIVFLDSSGNTRNAGTAVYWSEDDENTLLFTFPDGVAQSQTRHVGEYHIFVVSMEGKYVAGTDACLRSTWTGTCNIPALSAGVKQSMSVATATEGMAAANAALLAFEISQEETVKRYYQTFLGFVFRDTDFGIPNFVVFLLFCLTIFAGGIAPGYLRRD